MATIGNYDSDVFEGYLNLVAAMIRLAVIDFHSDDIDNEKSARKFLKSEFIYYLCESLDIDQKKFTRRIMKTKKIWHRSYD